MLSQAELEVSVEDQWQSALKNECPYPCDYKPGTITCTSSRDCPGVNKGICMADPKVFCKVVRRRGSKTKYFLKTDFGPKLPRNTEVDCTVLGNIYKYVRG